MKNILKKIIYPIRAKLTKIFYPKTNYFLFPTRSLSPISSKFGFDRGTPVDRYYIEKFIETYKENIRGKCLEITDNTYTKKFGGKNVSQSDVLDIDTSNKKANIHADLRNIENIPENSYDCIILTHTLGIVDDHEAAAKECIRILKPGGKLLVTVPAVGVAQEPKYCYWRYTAAGLSYLFEKHTPKENVQTFSFGNVLAGQAFWVGLSTEELTEDELFYEDARYAIVVAGIITK